MKKIIALGLSAVLALSLAAGCSKSDDKKTIKVGASVTPHADILRQLAPELEKEGYTLEVKEFTDYILPNTSVEDGDLDANFFQHQPYLDGFNTEHSTHIASVAAVHYEPMGIYAGKTTALADLKEGAIVGVPNDATNEARALLLLEANGIIKLKKDVGFKATIMDIEENTLKLEFSELDAAQLTLSLPDLDIAVINGNYAQQGELKLSDALAIEDKESLGADTYANVLCVKEGSENEPWVKALVKAITSDATRTYIQENFGESAVPIF